MLKNNLSQALSPRFRYFRTRAPALCALVIGLSAIAFSQSPADVLQNPTSFTAVPRNLLIRIVRAEDERRWDKDVRDLLSARSAVVRRRAALAAGRIGNEDSVADLIKLLRQDDETDVRAMAAFALGEVESASGDEALLEVLGGSPEPLMRARTVEALGKIAAALPKEQETRARLLGNSILKALQLQSEPRSEPARLSVLLGLTAALRAKTSDGGPTIARFLTYSDPRIRADAANTLARLKLKDGNDQLRRLLVNDPDPTVRANAARVMGATANKEAFESLVNAATRDQDSRVRVSALRALVALKDQEPRVANALVSMSCDRKSLKQENLLYHERAAGCLEIVSALGRVFQGTNDQEILSRVSRWRWDFLGPAPEVEVARARISPETYLAELGDEAAAKRKVQRAILTDWREASSLAQGLGEFAALPESTKERQQLVSKAEALLRSMLDYRDSGIVINTLIAVHSEYAIPDVLRAFAAFKPKDLDETLRKHLKESDVVIRATAAELLSELPANATNTRALVEALPVALLDKKLNDAALSILDSLAKQKSTMANDAIKTALDSPDHLIRRKAVALLKANSAGNFSSRIGTVQTRNTTADYERAIGRIDKNLSAVVTTSKGAFTVQLLPEAAPLTVDNFIQLAQRNYFGGISIHRVVPNFVIQDGDPRGDGNGGPGYQIRCEINEVPYDRGAVGMALSGKDTGGSQWFVTHSAQPHLDGGYTVFGRVIRGMDVVDNVVRGDVIRSIVIKQTAGPGINRRQRAISASKRK